jgi:short-subunit dehydrogenase
MFEYLSVEHLDKMMQINYVGTLRVIKYALPLLKKAKGSRIINVTSAAAYASCPTFTGYSGSKFAVRGFSNGLRQELKHWDIHVTCIEPAFMKTPVLH